MSRWTRPLLAAAAAGAASYFAMLHYTPDLLMAAALRKTTEASGGYNHMVHRPLTTAENQTIIRPSPDLLYSACPYDVSVTPLIIHAVPVPGHYSSISVFDARTDVAGVLNDEAMAGQPATVIVARDGQAVPVGNAANAKVIRVHGARGIVLQRVLLGNVQELASIDAIRRQTSCSPLVETATGER